MNVHWHELFAVHMAPLEIVIRGSVIYWFLFLVFRFVMRRDVGSMAVSDILLLVIIADASQNAMAGEYKTVSEGILLLVTILGWNILLDWAGWRFIWIRKFVQAAPLLLIRDGVVHRENMRREFISLDDLLSKLRQQGIEDPHQVKRACLEPDGEISVVRMK